VTGVHSADTGHRSGLDQNVLRALVIPLALVIRNEFSDRSSEML